jgi:SAM-dependent methyltransferase
MSAFTKLHKATEMFGFDPVRTIRAARRIPYFVRTLKTYQECAQKTKFPLSIRSLFPILEDMGQNAGSLTFHYFHQDLWAASKIFERRPERHVDIGSRIDGFIAHLLVFMPVESVDIRPLDRKIPGLTFIQNDATDLKQFVDESVVSLSSLHAVEHFGLGRYGDPIDADAPFKAMREFMRILKKDGRLYFSVPIGNERVEFNAHRIFAPATVVETFRDLDLLSFAAVDDAGNFFPQAELSAFGNATCACGLFEFTKG